MLYVQCTLELNCTCTYNIKSSHIHTNEFSVHITMGTGGHEPYDVAGMSRKEW